MIMMAMMHKHMHERAGQKDQVGQKPQQMRPVLRQQVKCRDTPQHKQGDAAT